MSNKRPFTVVVLDGESWSPELLLELHVGLGLTSVPAVQPGRSEVVAFEGLYTAGAVREAFLRPPRIARVGEIIAYTPGGAVAMWVGTNP